jgi:hypothetical protein
LTTFQVQKKIKLNKKSVRYFDEHDFNVLCFWIVENVCVTKLDIFLNIYACACDARIFDFSLDTFQTECTHYPQNLFAFWRFTLHGIPIWSNPAIFTLLNCMRICESYYCMQTMQLLMCILWPEYLSNLSCVFVPHCSFFILISTCISLAFSDYACHLLYFLSIFLPDFTFQRSFLFLHFSKSRINAISNRCMSRLNF